MTPTVPFIQRLLFGCLFSFGLLVGENSFCAADDREAAPIVPLSLATFGDELATELPEDHPLVSESARNEWEQLWNLPVSERLDALVSSLSRSVPELNETLAGLSATAQHQLVPEQVTIPPQITTPTIATNVHLWAARSFMHRQLFEECRALLERCDESLLIDPASYYFCKAVSEHHLLETEAALASLETLLERCSPLPARYKNLGELMRYDLKQLKQKSLGEIAKKMTDVERRLQLGRSGEKVQQKQKEIIETLDEIIEKMEEQSGGGSSAGAGSSNQSQQAANESRVKGSTAPGEVDNKTLGNQDGWGNLPEKEKSKAKQVINTLFPPHYQKAIEAFNRKAAQRSTSP